MNPLEEPILARLDELVSQPQVAQLLNAIAQATEQSLIEHPTWISTAIPVNLQIYGDELPGGIRSSRVFALRACSASKIERHPNSHQRVLSLRGLGEVRVLENQGWSTHVVQSNATASLAQRWISVAENLWHQPIAHTETWLAVAFHRASEDTLIDEYWD